MTDKQHLKNLQDNCCWQKDIIVVGLVSRHVASTGVHTENIKHPAPLSDYNILSVFRYQSISARVFPDVLLRGARLFSLVQFVLMMADHRLSVVRRGEKKHVVGVLAPSFVLQDWSQMLIFVDR